MDGNEVVDVRPSAQVDATGYHCHRTTTPYVGGAPALLLTDDQESLEVELPFEMPSYTARALHGLPASRCRPQLRRWTEPCGSEAGQALYGLLAQPRPHRRRALVVETLTR